MSIKLPLGGHSLTVVAVEARVDRQTVMRYLRGDKVRFLSQMSIEEALRRLGHENLIHSKAA